MTTTRRNSSHSLIPGPQVRVNGNVSHISVPAKPAPHETFVNTIRSGGRVEMIEVTCTCGEIIRLVCDYSEPANPREK